jgi:hypothetical protein
MKMKLLLALCLIALVSSCSPSAQKQSEFKKEFRVNMFPHNDTELEAVTPMIKKRLWEAANVVSAFEQEMQVVQEQAMLIPIDTALGLEKYTVALRKYDTMESHHHELIRKCEHLCDLSCSTGFEAHYCANFIGRVSKKIL